MKKPVRKILGATFAVAVAALLLALATLSVWLPWVAPPLAERAGVHIGSINRVGGHYVLADVTWADAGAGLSCTAETVELPTPWSLLRRGWLEAGETRVTLAGARLVKTAVAVPADVDASPAPRPDLPALVREALQGWDRVTQWITRVTVDELAVDWEGQAARVESLSLDAARLGVRAEALGLPGYTSARVSLDLTRAGGQYSLHAEAFAEAEQLDLPPLRVVVATRGTADTATVDAFSAEAWGSAVQLAAPLAIDLHDLAVLPDARLTLDFDLGAQPLVPVQGRITGAVTADHRPGALPLIRAELDGTGVAYTGVILEMLALRAVLDWPQLRLEQLAAATDEGARMDAQAAVDLEREWIEQLDARVDAPGALLATLAPLLGEPEVRFDTLHGTFQAEGPADALRHQGELAVSGLASAQSATVDLDLAWRADWLTFSALDLGLRNADAAIELSAQASLGGPERSVSVDAGHIAVTNQPELVLHAPFTVVASPGGPVTVSPLWLDSSTGGQITLSADVDYPRRGTVDFQARDVSSQWLDLLLDEPLPFPAEANGLSLFAQWDGGPLEAAINADVLLFPPEQPAIKVALALGLSPAGVELSTARVSQGSFTLLEAQGALPMRVTPGAESPVAWDSSAALAFQLQAQPDDAPAWNLLEERLEIDFIHPWVNFAAEGSLAAPQGTLRLGFDALEPLDSEDAPSIPAIQKAQLAATFSEERVVLDSAEVRVAGQSLRASGEVPMGEAAWSALIDEGTAPDWQTARAQVDFADVPLAAFAQWLPPVLREEGDFSLRAWLEPGQAPTGTLTLDGWQTRPLAQLGAVSEINATFALTWPTLTVERAEALVGGAPLGVGGTVTLGEAFTPRFNLRLSGQNVPLVRSPGLILRASPEVTLMTGSDDVTTVGGAVRLNESFFTMDLTMAGVGGGGGASAGGSAKGPPYFSIEDEPVADWRLDLQLTGDRFLRVRVPAFEGVVSADFSLRGALRDPFMFGRAELEQGAVLFPFATLRLDQGAVTISQNDPDTPMLDVVASGRAYGYDLQMRVSGTANDPTLSFTSTPSLEQTDILLMVTSGQIPNNARSTGSRLSGIGLYIGNSFLVDLGLIDPLDDTLTVNVGEDVTTSGRDTVNVRYRFSDDWAAVGAYDKYDAYYLDAEWTVYSD